MQSPDYLCQVFVETEARGEVMGIHSLLRVYRVLQSSDYLCQVFVEAEAQSKVIGIHSLLSVYRVLQSSDYLCQVFVEAEAQGEVPAGEGADRYCCRGCGQILSQRCTARPNCSWRLSGGGR